jgi:hypothetical protein
MTLWGILIIMGVQFLGIAIGVAFHIALGCRNKYSALANLALYTGGTIYLCFVINPLLLIPMVFFAVIGKLLAPSIERKWDKYRDSRY